MTDFRLFDNPGADVAHITTDGNTLKPFINTIQQITNEARLNINADGLHVRVNDPANVCMLDIHLGADAFHTYGLEREKTVGVYINTLKKLCRRARKGSGDKLDISIQEYSLAATVARGYENHNVVSQGTMQLIDADSLREEPGEVDYDPGITVEIDAAPFTDAVSYAMGSDGSVSLSAQAVNQHANALYVSGETDTREESAAIDNVEPDATGEARYACGYMGDVLSGVSELEPDTVTVRFEDEMPLTVSVENDDVPVKAQFMIAPRISSD